MNPLRVIRIFALCCLVAAGAPASLAEKWTTANGAIEGKISGVYGTIAHIVGKKSMNLVPLNSMDDASLDLVAKYLATVPAEKPWAEATSPLAKAMRGKLQVLKDGKLAAFDPGSRAEPEFYVLYYSAHWCGPCRKFTPILVQHYNRLRNRAFGEKCEVLFMSWDNSRGEQADYVAEVGMPWLIVKYKADIDLLDRWKPRSIPGLAVINRNGDLVFHSHEGDKYRGPTKPLQDLLALLREMEPGETKYQQGRHRLAIRQQIIAGANQSLTAKPYYNPIDHKRYQGLPVPQVRVNCRVNEKGTVDSYTVEPELPAAYGHQARQDINRWLFLPAVENGKPLLQEIVVPINFVPSASKEPSDER